MNSNFQISLFRIGIQIHGSIVAVKIYYVIRNVGLERKLQKQEKEMKMDRNKFTEVLCRTVLTTLGEEYRTELSQVRKNHGVMKEVLNIRKEGSECIPCFYTEELYRSYCEGEHEMGLAEHMADIVLNECDAVRQEVRKYMKKEWIAEHLFVRLVQTEQNKEWLEDTIYVPYLDLAAVVYVLTEDCEEGIKSFLLPKYFWDTLGVGTPEEYFPEIVANTKRLFPESLWCIENRLKEGENVWEIVPKSPEEKRNGLRAKQLYALSNRRKVNGAAVILYPELLMQIYEWFSGAFFVIPSSVHEVLLLKDTGEEDEEVLNCMVSEVNEKQVEPEEVLAGHVYYYSAEKGLCKSRDE